MYLTFLGDRTVYATKNFRTKKALKEAVKGDTTVECHQPGPFGPGVKDGDHTCEGPHFPAAHKWYATVRVSAGRIIKVLS